MARRFDILINAKDKGASATFKKVGAAIAGFMGAAIIKNQIADLIDLGDNIGKTSARIGIAAEDFQKFAFAARRGGATGADVEKAFKRMSSTIFDAGRGVKESVDGLNELGLSFDQLQGKGPAKQFSLIADALNKVEDKTNKAALAQDVFGRAGTALIPMLNNYKELGKELEAMGGVIKNENVKAAEQFKDALEDITTSIKAGLANSGLIKWLGDVTGAFAELAKSGNATRHILDTIFGVKQHIELDAPDQGELAAARRKRREKREAAEKAAQAKATGVPVNFDINKLKTVDLTAKDAVGQDPALKLFDVAETFATTVVDAGKDVAGNIKAAAITGPQQAFVTRGLSGLGTTQRPIEQTAKHTKATADAAAQTNDKLDTLIAVNKKNTKSAVVLADAKL